MVSDCGCLIIMSCLHATQGWHGHVKAKWFVFALASFYREQLDTRRQGLATGTVPKPKAYTLPADIPADPSLTGRGGETPLSEHRAKLPTAYERCTVNAADAWALEYVSNARLQSIIEAFDDDASGFITIAEVNKLMSQRPKGWRYVECSLLHQLYN